MPTLVKCSLHPLTSSLSSMPEAPASQPHFLLLQRFWPERRPGSFRRKHFCMTPPLHDRGGGRLPTEAGHHPSTMLPVPCRPHMTWPSLRVFQSLTGEEANAPGNCLNTAPATGKAGSQLPAVTQLLPRPPRGTTRPLRGQRATLKGTRGPADDDGPWHSGEPLSASYSPPASTLETPAEEPAPGCPAMLCGLRQVA